MFNFKNNGKTIEKSRLEESAQNIEQEELEIPIGIALPLQKGIKKNEDLFKMNYDVFSQVSNNFKQFLMTKKGEVLCNPDYGTILSDIYNRTDLELEDIENIVMNDISEGVAKFFSFINLLDFSSKEVNLNDTFEEDYVKVSIRYTVQGFEENVNTIELSIRRSI